MNHIIVLGIIIGVIGIFTLIAVLKFFRKDSIIFQLILWVAFFLISLGTAAVFMGRAINISEDSLKEERLNNQDNEAETMERNGDVYRNE